MTLFLEKNVDLTKEELDFFSFVKGDNFPWYHNNIYPNEDVGKGKYFSHMLMKRNGDVEEGIVNSQHYDYTKNFITKFCKQNGYNVKTFYRMSFNFVYFAKYKPILHKDHDFSHYVFIMYLNDFDQGYTGLYDEDEKFIQNIVPKMYKAAIYNGNHTMGYPSEGQCKMTLIATFGT